MVGVTGRLRAWGRAGAERLAPTVMASISEVPRLVGRVAHLEGQVRDLERTRSRLRERISELELEVQECRRLQTRVAEVTDFVVEVLIPAADRDDERLRHALETYERDLL
ncbi:MAG: hypothetical protein GEU83_08935 [Pseudonocardiaceae bacterium]|nr:hypothetical protein [Pseudonocardiaceae bacterium]